MSGGSYDAVVVGSGPNGLSAAITLAAAGRSVLVLEAADRPGGAVISDDLTLPGFHHDTWSAVYPAAVASPVFERMPLDAHGLRWIHPELCYAHPLTDGRAGVLSRDLEVTVDSLERLHPGDGLRWREFAQPFLDNIEALRHTMLAGFPPVRGPLRLLGGLGPLGMLEFVRLVLMPAAALGQELFRAPGSRAWLYGSSMHGDVPPIAAGSAVAAAYLNFLGHAFGWPSPEGGAYRLTEALVGYLESLGGSVRTEARVVRVAVSTAGSAGSSSKTATGCRPPWWSPTSHRAACSLWPSTRCRTATQPPYSATATARDAQARLGAVGPDPVDGVRGPSRRHDPRRRGRARDAALHGGGRAGRDAEHPFPARRPAVHLRSEPRARRQAHGVGLHARPARSRPARGPRAPRRRRGRADRAVRPGFRDLILARNVQSPQELERRNANLVGGDLGAGSYTLDQIIFRPIPGLAPYRTPVAGLYIGSASTFPGGAVHGVPGHAAARLALAEGRIRRPFTALRGKDCPEAPP